MLKIISKKEYDELVDYKNKYLEITGQQMFIITGGRSMYSKLIHLSKEQLIHLVMEMRDDIRTINKKLRKQYKCRVEKVDDI